MRVEEVEGLSQLPEEELTHEEREGLEVAKDEAEESDKRENADLESVMKAFEGKPDAPDYDEVLYWREQYGSLHVSTVFAEEDLYIWRILKRQEYKQMTRSGILNEESRAEEAIIKRCLLYPKPSEKFLFSSAAGVMSTLKEQIMYRSGFIPASLALSQIKVL